MSSFVFDRLPQGTLNVHDNDMVEELVIDHDDHIKTTFIPRAEFNSRRARIKRPQSTPHPSKRHNQRNTDHKLRFQTWLSNKTVSSIQEKADPEAREAKKMYESVLETEDTFVKEMEELVRNKNMLNTRKREMLHKTWNDQVHEPIRKEILTQMSGPAYPELARRKRELHKEYLEHVNKKGHVFLDTIAPEEYYALSLHPTRPGLLTAGTRQLHDPLLAQERQRSAEDRVIFRCETGAMLSDRALATLRLPPVPLVPLGRHGTECHTWLAMPMGDIESPVRNASSIWCCVNKRRRMHTRVNDSHFNFENWGQRIDQTVVDHEMQIQKRRTVFRDVDHSADNPAVHSYRDVDHSADNPAVYSFQDGAPSADNPAVQSMPVQC